MAITYGMYGECNISAFSFQYAVGERKFQVRSNRLHIDTELETTLLQSCKVGLAKLLKMSTWDVSGNSEVNKPAASMPSWDMHVLVPYLGNMLVEVFKKNKNFGNI